MSLTDSLVALAARLTTYTPTRDPSIRFSHDTQRTSERVTRSFRLLPPFTTRALTTDDCLCETDLTLEIYYQGKTQRFSQLSDIADDQEEIYTLLSDVNGSTWGATNSLTCHIDRMEISEADEVNDLTLRCQVSLNYQKD